MNRLQLTLLRVLILYLNVMMAVTALYEMFNPVPDDHYIFANLDDIPGGELEPKRRRIAEDHSYVIDPNPNTPPSGADFFDTLMPSYLPGFSDHTNNPGSTPSSIPTIKRESWELGPPDRTETHGVPSAWASGGLTRAPIEAPDELTQAFRKHLRQAQSGVHRGIRVSISRPPNEGTGLQLPKVPTPMKYGVGFRENRFTTAQERRRPYGLGKGPIADFKRQINDQKVQMEALYNIGRKQHVEKVEFGGLSIEISFGRKNQPHQLAKEISSLEGKDVFFRVPYPRGAGTAATKWESMASRIKRIGDSLDDLYSNSITNIEKLNQRELAEITHSRKALLDWYYNLIFTDTGDHPPLLGSTPFDRRRKFNEAQKVIHRILTGRKGLHHAQSTSFAEELLKIYKRSVA
ncbi:hypothetical protein KEM48_005215 [Puccinia striiformis f. sp. tritici PST-130]|nr:hypothetical protein KEM48_005215 [Puccinia striiformis f. sp. tritici PST-130]